MAYGRGLRRMAILILSGEEDPFPNQNRKRDYSSPNEYRMKIEISFFSENFDIESFLDWSMK